VARDVFAGLIKPLKSLPYFKEDVQTLQIRALKNFRTCEGVLQTSARRSYNCVQPFNGARGFLLLRRATSCPAEFWHRRLKADTLCYLQFIQCFLVPDLDWKQYSATWNIPSLPNGRLYL